MYDGMLATLTISAKKCGPAMVTRLLRAASTSSALDDARQLLYHALVARALGHCGRTDVASRASHDILARGEQLTTSATAQEIVDVWRLAETRCTLSGSPGVTEAQVLTLLPRPGAETWTGYALFAGVRLTDIVGKGCGSSWWGPTGH
jgi:hypothetical protein